MTSAEAVLPFFPISPMGRMNLYVPARGGLGPTAENAMAGENDGVRIPIGFDNGHFQVPVKRGGFNLHPCHHAKIISASIGSLIVIKTSNDTGPQPSFFPRRVAIFGQPCS